MNVDKKTENKKEASRIPPISYGDVGRVLLGTVAVAGVLTVALAAPGIFQAVKWFRQYEKMIAHRYQTPSYVRKTLRGLARRGMVRIVERQKGEMEVRLTDKGEQELLKYTLREKLLKKHAWDKKWRIVVFDIEEKRRVVRNRVRIIMQSFGFEKLQDSVWVYPYECEEVVTLLKAQYKVGKELVYIVAGDIENDAWLRKKFDLV